MQFAESRRTYAPAHGRSKAGTHWTDSLVAYGLDRFHRANLRTPTQREIRTGVDDLPSYPTVQRMYGTFGNMLRAHGYRVRPRGGSRAGRLMPDRDRSGRFLSAPHSPDRGDTPRDSPTCV
jgi:hypothetical protein